MEKNYSFKTKFYYLRREFFWGRNGDIWESRWECSKIIYYYFIFTTILIKYLLNSVKN